MRVLVIGGSGFIGTHLVRALLNSGHAVEIFDRRSSSEFDDLVTIGDIRSQEQLAEAVEGSDVVYHLAAEHRDDVRPPSRYYEVNVDGTRNVVDACEAHGVETLVFTSTIAVYGSGSDEPSEEAPPDPDNDYGHSKLEAEKIIRDWARASSGRSAVIVRPAVVFGQGHTGNVRTLIRQVESRKFVMVGEGGNRKSMCYVGNLVKFLCDHAVEGDKGVRIINFADKPDLEMAELVGLIRNELGMEQEWLPTVPYWLGLVGGYLCDGLSRVTGRSLPINSKRVRKFCAETTVACSELDAMGFQRPYSLAEGLRRTIHGEVVEMGSPLRN